jgi:hypothetical protein
MSFILFGIFQGISLREKRVQPPRILWNTPSRSAAFGERDTFIDGVMVGACAS